MALVVFSRAEGHAVVDWGGANHVPGWGYYLDVIEAGSIWIEQRLLEEAYANGWKLHSIDMASAMATIQRGTRPLSVRYLVERTDGQLLH